MKKINVHALCIASLFLAILTPPLFAANCVLHALKPAHEWKGKFANPQDEPLMREAPECGYIANANAWNKLWKAWRQEEPVPALDFKTQLAMVGVTPCAGNGISGSFSVDENGDLKGAFAATMMAGPGFAYTIVVIDRTGIKTYRGKPLG